jgi:hypothetical protein
VLDTVARHFTTPMRKTGGKLRKDDQKMVKNYLQEKYVDNHIDKRNGRYEPTQIVRNFGGHTSEAEKVSTFCFAEDASCDVRGT